MNRDELSNEINYCTLRAARRRGGTRGSDSDAEFNGYLNGYVLRDVRQFRPQPQQRANAQVTVQQ